MHDIGDLVDDASVLALPGTPLLAVDGSKLAFLVGPLVPDGDALFLEPTDIAVAAQEPEQFENDALQMQFLGGEQRKALAQIEAQLAAEHAARAGAGAVAAVDAVVEDVLQETK